MPSQYKKYLKFNNFADIDECAAHPKTDLWAADIRQVILYTSDMFDVTCLYNGLLMFEAHRLVFGWALTSKLDVFHK